MQWRCWIGALAISLAGFSAHAITIGPDDDANIGGTFTRPFSVTFVFSGLPANPSDGVLTAAGFGDIDNPLETVSVSADGVFIGELFNGPFLPTDPGADTDTVTIPSSLLGDGAVSVSLVVPLDSGTSFVRIDAISLTFAVPEPGTLPALAAFAVVALLRHRRAERAFVHQRPPGSAASLCRTWREPSPFAP